jgi:hypothetical protein
MVLGCVTSCERHAEEEELMGFEASYSCSGYDTSGSPTMGDGGAVDQEVKKVVRTSSA